MKGLDGIGDGHFGITFDTLKSVQDELAPYGIEATWTYIWETKSIRVKLWYIIHNEYRSAEVWLSEKDFKQGFAYERLAVRIEEMSRGVSDQRYLAEKRIGEGNDG